MEMGGVGGGVDVVGYCRPTDCRDDSELYRRWRWEVGGEERGGRCSWLGRPTDFRDDSGLYEMVGVAVVG